MRRQNKNEHETALVKDIQLELSRGEVRLWRNNVGEAWAGPSYETSNGGIVIANPYRVNFGLCPGSGDLIGYKAITVTPEMVGRRLAVFASLEVKRPRPRPIRVTLEQKDFIQLIQSVGGISDLVRSIDDAQKIIDSV